MSAFKHLRVEEGTAMRESHELAAALLPPAPMRRRPVPTVEAYEQALKDAAYWRGETQRAVREREEIKKSLESQEGPAAYWRHQAKDASRKLSDALKRIESARKHEEEQRAKAIVFSEEVDALKDRIQGLKRGLWNLFCDLEDSPLRRSLWDFWANV